MKKKLLRLFMMVSKYTLYGTLLQLIFLSLVFASKTEAQRITSIKKAEILVEFNQSSLFEVFSSIEANTNFQFVYFSPDLRTAEKRFDLKRKKVTVADLLLMLSEEYQLAFKQVNNSIMVRKLAEDQIGTDKSVEIVLQRMTVTGQVTSMENPDGLPGVNVVIKGTAQGTVTDIDGNYSIEVPSPESILVFSSVGYVFEEVTVGNKSVINMDLTPDVTALEEIVVIGYGEQKSSDISGAVSTVSVQEIKESPVANLSNTLAGRTPGIIATQPTGEPGNDNAVIRIRGAATTGGSSEPIYVIDGIVRSSSDFFQLNSNEIESVSILKDAASAAVFGMRAGNGVVLVTTKRGREGKMQISFSGNFAIQERTREPEFLNSYEYALLRNEALENSGQQPEFSDEDIQKYLDGSSPDTHPDTDWFDLIRKSAPMQQYNLSATGGTENIQYATSLSYLDQEGITTSDDFRRYNFRSNIDANVTNTTRFSFDISYRKQKRESLGKGNELFRWLNTQPNKAPLEFSNGGVASGPAYIALTENGYRRNEVEALRTRIQLEQQIPFIDGLSVKLIGAFDDTQTDNKNWYYPVVPFYTVDGNGNLLEQPLPANSLDENSRDDQAVTLQAHLNYEKSFGKFGISALALYTQTETTQEFIGGHREGYTIGIDELKFGGAANQTNDGYSGTSGRQGFVGRLNLAYAEKYLFEASVRRDGSEQFAPDQRWGTFPSISGAYIISKEPFMSDISFLDFLKIRGSYGLLGNDRISGSSFLYLQSYNINAGRFPYAVFGDGNIYPTIEEGRLASPNVTWETVAKTDIGFDAFFMDAKLSLTFDYFYEKRTDILGDNLGIVPDFFGIALPIENVTRVDNRGFEMSVRYEDQVTDDFFFSVNANITHAKNEVVFIPEPEDINPNLSRIGHPLGMAYGYRALGIFQTQEEVDNWATQVGDTAPGDIKMEDINGDGEINELDRVPIGVSSGSSNVPEYILGFNGQIKYKNFGLSFLLQGATGVNQYTCCEGVWPFFGDASTVKSNLDYWTTDNRDAPNPRILVHPTGNLNHDASSFWMKDASYVRLKNVEISYTAPQGFFGNNFIQGLRVYVNANNVATWTKIENWDPEYADDRYWSYPQLRVWNAGFELSF